MNSEPSRRACTETSTPRNFAGKMKCRVNFRPKLETVKIKYKLTALILTKKENFINQHHTFLDPPKEWLELSKSIILFWLTNQRTPLKKLYAN